MIEISYTKTFLKRYKKIDSDLQEEIKERIDLFKDKKNHKRLKVDKLKGKYKGFLSFSINRKDRILFQFVKGNSAIFLDIDDHDIYK